MLCAPDRKARGADSVKKTKSRQQRNRCHGCRVQATTAIRVVRTAALLAGCSCIDFEKSSYI
jgi:hypothetical protein